MDLLQRARELYRRGEMHDALEAAQAACERHPKDPEAWRLLGSISRYTGMPVASDDAFRRASQLGRRHPFPHRVTFEAFERMLEAVRTELSPDATRRLGEAAVRVVQLPPLDSVRAGVSPDALHSRVREPADVLFVYQVNHENRSRSASALRGLLARSLSRA